MLNKDGRGALPRQSQTGELGSTLPKVMCCDARPPPLSLMCGGERKKGGLRHSQETLCTRSLRGMREKEPGLDKARSRLGIPN